jgi:hypothetical protein
VFFGHKKARKKIQNAQLIVATLFVLQQYKMPSTGARLRLVSLSNGGLKLNEPQTQKTAKPLKRARRLDTTHTNH